MGEGEGGHTQHVIKAGEIKKENTLTQKLLIFVVSSKELPYVIF